MTTSMMLTRTSRWASPISSIVNRPPLEPTASFLRGPQGGMDSKAPFFIAHSTESPRSGMENIPHHHQNQTARLRAGRAEPDHRAADHSQHVPPG